MTEELLKNIKIYLEGKDLIIEVESGNEEKILENFKNFLPNSEKWRIDDGNFYYNLSGVELKGFYAQIKEKDGYSLIQIKDVLMTNRIIFERYKSKLEELKEK